MAGGQHPPPDQPAGPAAEGCDTQAQTWQALALQAFYSLTLSQFAVFTGDRVQPTEK